MSKIYEKRCIKLEKDIKELLHVIFDDGNKALPTDGGDPADYGFPNDEDMAEILEHAAEQMRKSGLEYLYRRNSPGHDPTAWNAH
jgi:hypothetical protein